MKPRLPTLEAIARWLPHQRWFGAKTRRITGLRFADAVPLGPGVVVLVDVELDGAGHERYAVPLIPGADLADALGDVDFGRAVLSAVARGDVVSGERGEIRGVPAPAFPEHWRAGPPADLTVRRIGGEQSNTSLVLGEVLVLKHFRKLTEGINPEAEIARFLTERTVYANTPRLAGHLEYRDERSGTTTLGVLQQMVAGAVDGWQWVLARLRQGDGAGETARALRKLGERTGELHQALASDSSDPAFTPERIAAADIAAWADAVTRQLVAARQALGGEDVAADPSAVRQALGPLLGRRKIRHHGDFHLGQTLYEASAEDWMIIDFEGEPLRPLEERRRKHAAPRDVAGMLRSIDYAAVSASDLRRPLREWGAAAARAFLDGYRATAGAAPFLPELPADLDGVVAVFELEKAAYEVVYEANNRPDWIAIPRQGLVTAAARLGRAAA